jgi:hypothetical protein
MAVGSRVKALEARPRGRVICAVDVVADCVFRRGNDEKELRESIEDIGAECHASRCCNHLVTPGRLVRVQVLGEQAEGEWYKPHRHDDSRYNSL